MNDLNKIAISQLFTIALVVAIIVYILYNSMNECGVRRFKRCIDLPENERFKCKESFQSNEVTKTLCNMLWPVGSIYMTIEDDSPSSLFPNTTWEEIKSGVLIQSVGNGSENAGMIYGNNTLTTDNIPEHKHGILSIYDDCNYNTASLTDGYGMRSIFPDGDSTKTPYDTMSIPNDRSTSIENSKDCPRRTTYTENQETKSEPINVKHITVHVWKRTG